MNRTLSKKYGIRLVLCLLLLLNVLAVYSNHFDNQFQFDDATAVDSNLAIRDFSSVWLAFVDTSLFSSAPEQRTYRPVTTASLALDYWLGGKQNTFFFHFSTFFWFAVQLVLMFLFFEWLMNRVDPHSSNMLTALAATALFGLHPVNAETINYIIQRGDLYNALGCVAGVWLFSRFPSQRKFGWYLVPPVVAMLAKPPALIFPLLLLVYLWLFEGEQRPRWADIIKPVLPSLLATAAVAFVLARMQSTTWEGGAMAASPMLYRLTQPWVALHYFTSFFAPVGLCIDPGWGYVPGPWSAQALAGYFFLLAILAVGLWASFFKPARPVAFGIFWFLITLLPTSLMSLADVTNDHRMFFPFVGLTLAVVWTLRMALFQATQRLVRNPHLVTAAIVAFSLALVAAGAATRVRNRVWSTHQSLWEDATVKSPWNARAWNNYGGAFWKLGDYEAAFAPLEKAAALQPRDVQYQLNLLNTAMKLHRNETVEAQFQRLLPLVPQKADTLIAYSDWLCTMGRFSESDQRLEQAVHLQPHSAAIREERLKFQTHRDAGHRILLLRALDTDLDNIISEGEIVAAPFVLLGLDKDGDGKLSAEECGAHFGKDLSMAPELHRRMSVQFMASYPVLNALDANHDGEISANEIRDSVRNLRFLAQGQDGGLRRTETIPGAVNSVARNIMAALDLNHDGSLQLEERSASLADLLAAADANSDGIVTLDELADELYYRADRDKDGTVTPDELQQSIQPARLGQVARYR